MHDFGAGTHVGNLRDNNEDSYVCDPDNELWIVADGMGGLGFGEVASAISTHTVATQVKQGHGINQAIELAHKRIKEYADSEGQGTNMGTTIVLLLSQGSIYNIFWVGDSRAYSFYDQKFVQLTTDHSLVQTLIDQGEITREEAASDPRKNAVTRALGVQELETVRADSVSEKWLPGQKILLCSDGLTDCVSKQDIAEILSNEGSDQKKVDELIKAALAGGGKDNITIVLISASENTRKPENDTHVPGEGTDKTFVPNDNDTQRNYHREMKAQEPETPAPPKPDRAWFNLPNLLGALAMTIAIIVFAQFTTAGSDGAEPATLVQLEPEDVVPVARKGMPDIELPVPGTVLQLGLFSRLEGAETKQQEASRKGHVPFIEKKVNGPDIQYAVLLGPFHDPDNLASVASALKKAEISFFERPESYY